MRVTMSWLAVLAAFALLLAGCEAGPPAELQEESRAVQLGKAEMANVRIEMKGGELDVSSGAPGLLKAFFRYRGEGWKPEVTYSEAGFRGNLVVRQSRVAYTIGHEPSFRNEWQLRLNNDLPMDLNVSLGAGKSVLDLGGLLLRSLDVHLGAGELDLDLTGKWRKSFDARIRGGIGKAVVHLPKGVGVEARARGGIGEIKAPGFKQMGHVYTNDAFGETPVTLRLDIEGGIGEIKLELEG